MDATTHMQGASTDNHHMEISAPANGGADGRVCDAFAELGGDSRVNRKMNCRNAGGWDQIWS
jgi:hypothetical protein